MFYVYLLRSKTYNKIYTGFSKNLKNRIKKHFAKGVYTTKRMGEVELVFYEAFKSEKDARRREKYLKSTKGKRTVKLMLKESLGPIV